MTKPLNIFITGGSSGIGKMAAKKLIELGHTVIITGRSQSNLDEAEKFITQDKPTDKLYKVIMVLDDFKSIEKCVETVKSHVPYLDSIIHNASKVDAEFTQFCDGKVEGTVFANAIAPLYLNRLLLPLVEKSPNEHSKRIVFVASAVHDPENKIGGKEREDALKDVKIPNDFVGNKKGWNSSTFYALSKLATVWNAFELADRYPSISIVTICPGFVPTTNLARSQTEEARSYLKNVVAKQLQVTTEEESAAEYVYYVTDPGIESLSGNYFRYAKVYKASKDAKDKEKREHYWTYANELIDINIKKIR